MVSTRRMAANTPTAGAKPKGIEKKKTVKKTNPTAIVTGRMATKTFMSQVARASIEAQTISSRIRTRTAEDNKENVPDNDPAKRVSTKEDRTDVIAKSTTAATKPNQAKHSTRISKRLDKASPMLTGSQPLMGRKQTEFGATARTPQPLSPKKITQVTRERNRQATVNKAARTRSTAVIGTKNTNAVRSARRRAGNDDDNVSSSRQLKMTTMTMGSLTESASRSDQRDMEHRAGAARRNKTLASNTKPRTISTTPFLTQTSPIDAQAISSPAICIPEQAKFTCKVIDPVILSPTSIFNDTEPARLSCKPPSEMLLLTQDPDQSLDDVLSQGAQPTTEMASFDPDETIVLDDEDESSLVTHETALSTVPSRLPTSVNQEKCQDQDIDRRTSVYPETLLWENISEDVTGRATQSYMDYELASTLPEFARNVAQCGIDENDDNLGAELVPIVMETTTSTTAQEPTLGEVIIADDASIEKDDIEVNIADLIDVSALVRAPCADGIDVEQCPAPATSNSTPPKLPFYPGLPDSTLETALDWANVKANFAIRRTSCFDAEKRKVHGCSNRPHSADGLDPRWSGSHAEQSFLASPVAPRAITPMLKVRRSRKSGACLAAIPTKDRTPTRLRTRQVTTKLEKRVEQRTSPPSGHVLEDLAVDQPPYSESSRELLTSSRFKQVCTPPRSVAVSTPCRHSARRALFATVCPATVMGITKVSSSQDRMAGNYQSPQRPATARKAAYGTSTPVIRVPVKFEATTPETAMMTPHPKAPLKGVVAVVEVYTLEGASASGTFLSLLQRLGARITKTWTDRVTHVVFKDGSPATLQRVRMANKAAEQTQGVQRIQCVNTRWVLDCDEYGIRQNEEDELYSIDMSELPRGGKRRRVSMEPGILHSFGGTVMKDRKSSGSLSRTPKARGPSVDIRASPKELETPRGDHSTEGLESEIFGESSPDTPEWLKVDNLTQHTAPLKRFQMLAMTKEAKRRLTYWPGGDEHAL